MWKRKAPKECPSREVLEAFHFARLSGPEFATVAKHLEGCEICENTLMEIARIHLGLAQEREDVPSDQLLAEPEWKDLEAAAAAITPKPPTPASWAGYNVPAIRGYQIDRRLGKNVFEARPEGLDDEVIIRVFHDCTIQDPSALERLIAQSHEISSATQGCVLPIIDEVRDQKFTAIVTPFVEAESLATLIRQRRKSRAPGAEVQGKLATATDAEYLRDVKVALEHVIGAVSAIHQRGHLYPELRSSSVLIASGLTVYLDDFGTSSFEWTKRGGLGAQALTVSRYPDELPDILVAHPSFLSPEEWQMERAIDARADVFRLGVLAYHALTLELPYGEGSISRRTKPPPPPSKRQPLLSSDLDAILMRALAIGRDKRYASACEMHDSWTEQVS